MEHLLLRVNTRTGRQYRDEPAILAWELCAIPAWGLCNEPRCVSPTGESMADGIDGLADWATEMSSFVKSLDPNHLVGVGDDGYFRQRLALGNRLYNGSMGVDCDRLLEIRSIDFGTCHLYPDYAPNRSPGLFGAEWVRQQIAAGERANKPMLVEEYGVSADLGAGARNATYKTWLDQIIESGGVGALVWMIAATGADGNPYPDYDHYTIYSAGEVPSTPEFA